MYMSQFAKPYPYLLPRKILRQISTLVVNVLLVSAVTQNISWAGFYCWLLVFLGVGSHFYGESKNALYAYFDPYLPAILQNLAKQQQEVESTALGKSHEKKLTSLGDALLRKLDQPSS